jgi:hypothetical protein
METTGKDQGISLKVFAPNVRPLTEQEIHDLPEEKRKLAREAGDAGMWLEVKCPAGACISDEGNVVIEAKDAPPKKEKGFWLNLFCPEDRCVIDQGTDLP